MNGALFKQSSETARRATLRLTIGHDDSSPDSYGELPSPEQIEIARLIAENAVLEDRLHEMRSKWDGDLKLAHSKAYKEAADTHVRDDARLLDAIEHAVSDAKTRFDDFLSDAYGPSAAKLAVIALTKLVEVRARDDDWLGQVIAQRLKALAGQSGMTVALSSGEMTEAVERALIASGRTDIELKIDPSVAPGSARLVLKLGEVHIDPVQGVAAIVALLESGGAARD